MLLLWLLFCIWSYVGATVYIVDGKTGDDGNDGSTLGSAFKTIGKCVSQLENATDFHHKTSETSAHYTSLGESALN